MFKEYEFQFVRRSGGSRKILQFRAMEVSLDEHSVYRTFGKWTDVPTVEDEVLDLLLNYEDVDKEVRRIEQRVQNKLDLVAESV